MPGIFCARDVAGACSIPAADRGIFSATPQDGRCPRPASHCAVAMRLIFLGTSAGAPTRQRNVTAQALQFDDGSLWLLDCGEATQHRLMQEGLVANRITRILITHLHGDHVLGLPGLLASIAIQGRTDAVHLVGPHGLRELIDTVLRLTDTRLGYPLDIQELDATTGGTVGGFGTITVSAHPLVHRVPCLGFVLREGPRPGRFHPGRARHLGVPEGRDWGLLQRGATVTLLDGTSVRPAQVMDPPGPGRHLVLLGDTNDASGIVPAAQGCDLLVCEATFHSSRLTQALEWGHMTALMTGQLAAACRARTLVLTHLSARHADSQAEIKVEDLRLEAAAQCPDTTVLAAHDGWSLTIPPRERAAP